MLETVIAMRGTIYEKGYGLISQSVMRDKNLSAKAKAIYAYLCSFAGSGEDRVAFPGVQLMMEELGFGSKDTFYKFRKELELAGYITIEQKTDGQNRFTKCIYYIEAVVKPIEKPQKPVNKGKSPCPKNRDTENRDTRNQDTISISSINISLKNDCMIDWTPDSNHSQNNEIKKEIMDALQRYVPGHCYANNLPLGQDHIDQIYLMLLNQNQFQDHLLADIVRIAAERYFYRACEVIPGGDVVNSIDVKNPVGLYQDCYKEAIELYEIKYKLN